MAQTLDQILSSLGSIYDPQVNTLRTRQAEVPKQAQADIQAAGAAKDSAFEDILNGARRRGAGVAFGGIPLGEQAKYASTVYAPTVLKAKNDARDRALSLEDAINQINERRGTQAQSIYQYQTSLDEQKRQFDAQQAAAARAASAANSFSPSLFGGGGAAGGGTGGAQAQQRADGGFNYTYNGQPISAASYAAAKGIPFRDVLSEAAKNGDKGASTALGFVGNDYGYDPRKVTSQQLASLYNALVWGTGKSATYNSTIPRAQPSPAPRLMVQPNANPLNLNNPLAIRR